MKYSNKLITVLGPTAVGKTEFAVRLAQMFNGEIISADSRQVYIGMDIGTGKDLKEYNINNISIPYHLIDVIKPECEFNLYLFTQLFNDAYEKILSREHLPFLVGGTGLYISSILQNYSLKQVDFNSNRGKELMSMNKENLIELIQDINPKLHNTTDLKDKERLVKAIIIAESTGQYEELDEIETLVIGLYEDREKLKERIKLRLQSRLKNGMIEEVENLIHNGITHEKLRFFGLEYKFISLYLAGDLNYNDMKQKLQSSIIKFAKRQMTWFRKMEKEGININWIKNSETDKAIDLIKSFI